MSYKPKVLEVAAGGTGLATLTAHALYAGNGTSAPTAVSVGATGTVLAGATGADPSFTAAPSVTSITLSGGTALSNYTEGTFVPTMVGQSSAGTTTYTVQNGYYTRIGNMVTVWATIVVTAATGTGNILLGALPFTIKNQSNYNPVGACQISGAGAVTWPASRTDIFVQGISNSTTANIGSGGSAQAGSNVAIASATYSVVYTLSYQI